MEDRFPGLESADSVYEGPEILIKNVGHGLSCGPSARAGRKPEGIAHCPQQALMVVKRLRLETVLYPRTDHERGDSAATPFRNSGAAAIIGVESALIKNDKQDAVSASPKFGASQDLWNLLREPRVGLRKGSIVRVVK